MLSHNELRGRHLLRLICWALLSRTSVGSETEGFDCSSSTTRLIRVSARAISSSLVFVFLLMARITTHAGKNQELSSQLDLETFLN